MSAYRTRRRRSNSDSREHSLCLEREGPDAFLNSPLHTLIYSALKCVQSFTNIQSQAILEDPRWERKILSWIINQNAPSWKKYALILFLFNRYLHVDQRKKKWGKLLMLPQKSHLPVLLRSILPTSPYTRKYTPVIPYNHYNLLNS